MTALPDRLAARTLELVDIPSESGHEEQLREHLLTLVPSALRLEFAGDEAFFFVPDRRPEKPLVVLAGHYDTVPAQGNLPGRITDAAVHGLGASDMKGGLAVAIELVRELQEAPDLLYDLALLLFGREELPSEHNPLPALFSGSRAVHETELAILLEPTDGAIHAGCLGNVVARVTVHGTSGHSARPWDATNAIARAVDTLGPVLSYPQRDVLVGDLRFVETLSATRFESGIADNVIPGEATITLSFRYAPDRTPDEAEAVLRGLLPDDVTLEIVGNSPAGRVVTDSRLVEALRAAGDLTVEPKLAWTNVADFTARGIDAVNFGPGHTALAHRRDERVAIAALAHAYDTLRCFLTGSIGEDAA
ncbi:MAG TPA: succinyl-diaminopimelate desuccinylase [Gaiellaceae bacterium]|nr:succinyl-diaminopimelate desuccinylase [Gaiellaceae bacterium]